MVNSRIATFRCAAARARTAVVGTTLVAVLTVEGTTAAGVAQEPAARPVAATSRREVVVQNLTPHARAEWARVTVPFGEGQVDGPPALSVGGRPTVWEPFGATWPDGSWRFASALFPVRLPALGEARLRLEAGNEAALPPGRFGLAPHRIRVIVVPRGAQPVGVEPALVGALHQSDARKVALFRGRVGDTGVVAELTLEVCRGQSHAQLGVGVFFSDPDTEAMQVDVDRVSIVAEGLAFVPRHGKALGMRVKRLPRGTRVDLLTKTSLGDGQGVRRVGVLVPPLPEDPSSVEAQTLLAASTAPLAAAMDWTGSATFGPFGHVPPRPNWLSTRAQQRAAMAARHRAFAGFSRGDGDPFRAPLLGLAKRAGQTGDQNDFGVVQLLPVASTGLPSFLLETELSVLQEACRPVHYFEPDASPVDPFEHPEWVVWSGRTHWHCQVSKDRLGKPCPEPRHEKHGWSGKDRQHWSSNYLAGHYLLTGCPQTRLEIENEVRLYLAGQTVRPGVTTSGAGAPRGAGRSLLAASWLYLCTGDQRLRERMLARVHRVHRTSWAGRDLPEDRVRPFQVANPDDRILGGACRYWTPWQESLAAIGFAAVAEVTGGDEVARDLAEELALNTLRHGWRTTGPGSPIIANAVRWKDGGAPLTSIERQDPRSWHGSEGTAFSVWSISAVVIARDAARRRGLDELAGKADGILRRLRDGRRRPNDGWFDRFGAWDALAGDRR